ncbi:MAG: hypothetical protein EBY52_02160, partial [Actinobacteria bacterium]|nr:hypothetical protein [Actinomycetota bacterium]
MSDPTDEVLLRIPARPEYGRVVRVGGAALGMRQGLSFADIDELRLAVDEAVGVDPVDIAPKMRKPRQARRTEVDFRSQRLPDGRTWQAVVEGLGPGEKLKIVCPFGGSTIGSGFFAR